MNPDLLTPNFDFIYVFLPIFTICVCDGGAHTPLSITCGPSTHLLILKLDPNDSEGVAGSVVVDVDPAESLLASFDWYPFLTGVIVDHHGSPGLADTLFTADQEKT